MIEAKLDKGRGPVATVLVRRGTLKRGDIFVVGAESGKVRALIDDKGQQVKEAGPSSPGRGARPSGVPRAGDQLTVVENEARAREVAAYRARRDPAEADDERAGQPGIDVLGAEGQAGGVEYPLVVKADVAGLGRGDHRRAQQDLDRRDQGPHPACGRGRHHRERRDAGGGLERAPIIGFNVRANAKAREIATRDGVALKYYDVIYDLIDEMRAAMAGKLGPE